MPRLNVKELIEREAKAQARKDEWRSIYEDCYEFALPQRNLYSGYYEGKVAGKGKMARVFDSTAIHSTQRFANRLQAGLFPPYKQWCRLEPGSAIPEQDQDAAQEALDRYNVRMFETLRQTNFDLAMGEFLMDLAVGTAVMMITPGDETTPIRFNSIPQYLVAIEEGSYGNVDNVYRKLRVKAESLQTEFPDVKMSVELDDAMTRSPEKELELVDAVILDQETGRYHYHVIWPAKKQELVYREMRSSPFVVARYTKVAGEVYGRGPLVTAISDIKTLNKTLELLLKNASLAIAGVYTAADDGVLNPQNVKIQPGSIISVARNGGAQGPSLTPLPKAGDFNVSQIVINDLRMNIKKIMMDDTLPPDNMSARSATEISERTRELATNLGSAFGRMITEILVPIVSRTLYVLDQQGMIDLPLRVNGIEVKVTPVSPLAQAQKLQEINDVMQYMQIANSMGPQGQTTVAVDRVLKFIAERLGISQELLATPQEQQMMMQQLQQMMAPPEAQQAEGAIEEAMV
ncbi:portal protein [Alphaproteobacteria bacterium]|nr:hypothetical protein [Phycisphaerae bacterium]MDB2638702.1 portal protein [Alphaproteobacteria bacterium]